MAAVAERISGCQAQLHDLILGKPVQYLGGPPLLADIATELPLPGDEWFTGLKRVVQIGGILVGFLTGQPLLVNACLKSLTHDAVLEAVSRGIGALLADSLESVGICEREVQPNRTKDIHVEHMVSEFQPVRETSSKNDPGFTGVYGIADGGISNGLQGNVFGLEEVSDRLGFGAGDGRGDISRPSNYEEQDRHLDDIGDR